MYPRNVTQLLSQLRTAAILKADIAFEILLTKITECEPEHRERAREGILQVQSKYPQYFEKHQGLITEVMDELIEPV